MYTYTKLKEALMGTSKNLPKEWTPNSVKAIIIGSQFIFIAYHIKAPKVVQLDSSEVMGDLKLNGTNGSLVNLLKQKQLSCVEEVYVDSLFQNYKGLMNLEEYVASLVNSRSRLRYYGYCQGLNPNELVQLFSEAQNNQQGAYTYAGDKRRTGVLQYESTQNSNWHSKYNLRPDKYPVGDSENGSLAKYFRRIENQVEEQYKAELTRLEQEGLAGAVLKLYSQDVESFNTITAFFALNKVLGKERGSGILCDSVLKCLSDVKSALKPVKISQSQLKGYLTGKVKPNKSLLDLYGKFFGVVSKENSQLQLKDLVDRVQVFDGLSGFTSALYSGVMKLVSEAKHSKNDLYIMLFVVFSNMGFNVKDGDFEKVIKEQRSHVGCAEVYVSILMGICGYTVESLKKYSRRISNV